MDLPLVLPVCACMGWDSPTKLEPSTGWGEDLHGHNLIELGVGGGGGGGGEQYLLTLSAHA